MKKKVSSRKLTPSIDKVDPKSYICIHEASLHNLKKLSVAINRKALTVVTGLSGSGKSSLVFDTLFAEGQRCYVESLSAYARQFLGRLRKPSVRAIRGISPAVAIQQRTRVHNPRSTVGTLSEVYDYLRLLYARVGITYSPISNQIVQRDYPADVLAFWQKLPKASRYQLLAPLQFRSGSDSTARLFRFLMQRGFSRLVVGEQTHYIEDLQKEKLPPKGLQNAALLIDRGNTPQTNTLSQAEKTRFLSSAQQAFEEGGGRCLLRHEGKDTLFSEHFECDGMQFLTPSVQLLSFNSPQGACPTCDGYGTVLGIDPAKVIPDPSLSLFEGAVAPWKGKVMKEEWLVPLIESSVASSFPIHRPYQDLTEAEQDLLWQGGKHFKGLHAFFKYLKRKRHKIQYNVLYARFQGKHTCPSCKGTRLRKEATYIRLGDRHLGELLGLSIEEVLAFFKALSLTSARRDIARHLLNELERRLEYLQRVGLGYLSLSRAANTLSGGEYQRLQLATTLGRPLVGALYILDEPSIGLHARDVEQLVAVLCELRDKGSPVIVVEHEELVMEAADELIDIGPEAGTGGGELVFQGNHQELKRAKNSYTADYLCGRKQLLLPPTRRIAKQKLRLEALRMHNLKNISLDIPLGIFCVVSGVSGSGKSTLVVSALHPALKNYLEGRIDAPSVGFSAQRRLQANYGHRISRSATFGAFFSVQCRYLPQGL